MPTLSPARQGPFVEDGVDRIGDGGGTRTSLIADLRGGGTVVNSKVSLGVVEAGEQLTRANLSWGPLGQATTVSFAFRATASGMPSDVQGFTNFTTAQIQATLIALQSWSDVAGITFVRQDDGAGYSDNATILFGNYATGAEGAAAFASLPGSRAPGAEEGDVWVNASLSYNAVPTLWGYGQLALVHEIGHALGLLHPADYNAGEGVDITYGQHATYAEDSNQYTVMSYFDESETGADFRTNGSGVQRYAAAPLMDDIAAAQRLYGANMTTRTGDTVYGFNSTAGQPWFSATGPGSPLVFCVWDAGGADTFDFSGYAAAGLIDLRQGSFSNVGGMVGNVSIALGVVIENALGGSGNDWIVGNSADNRIDGQGGNDLLDGGLGVDTVIFSGVRSDYTIVWNGAEGIVTGLGAQDTLRNVEFLQFADQTVAAAPVGPIQVSGDITNDFIQGSIHGDTLDGLGGDDVIDGGLGGDDLRGGRGNDEVRGGGGDDVIRADAGDDLIDGGEGLDHLYFTEVSAGVSVNLATGEVSGGAGTDTILGIEDVTGTTEADIIIGDDAANWLRGGDGIDLIYGGGGDDRLGAGSRGQGGGAPDIVKGAATANSSIVTAVSLTGAFDLGARADVADSQTIPHATVVATTHGGVEYYAVSAAAGERMTFDIDGAGFDSTLRLFNAAGVELAANDDDGSDGGASTDSRLVHTFAAAGTYYIQVAQWQSTPQSGGFTSGDPAAGRTYTLHVSSPSAPAVPFFHAGSTLNGEAGNDTLTGWTGTDTLIGGDGDDILDGGHESDELDGGAGTDTAVFSGDRFQYTITVVDGVTRVASAQSGTDVIRNVERLQFADGFTDAAGNTLVNPVTGTIQADDLVGTAFADNIQGFAGDDLITGGTGDDIIDGGDGMDTAIFHTPSGNVLISTVDGVTTVGSSQGTDTLRNVERLQFYDATFIVGAGGGRYYAGTAGANYIEATAFNDEIEGRGGADTLFGFAGDDVITGGSGNDTIDGGSGTDTAVFSGLRSAYVVSTIAGTTTVTGPDGVDTLTAVERLKFDDITLTLTAGGGQQIVGGAGNDALDGTAGADELDGAGGDDVINGFGSDDLIHGGDGDDVIDAGTGVDTVFGDAGNDTFRITAVTSDQADSTFDGGEGRDTFDASAVVVGLEFDGSVTDGRFTVADNTVVGVERIIGGSGNDFINLWRFTTSLDLLGGGGADHLEGGSAADRLYGGTGADQLIVRSGDHAYGEDGDDWLTVFEWTSTGTAVVDGGAGLDWLNIQSSSGPFGGNGDITIDLALGTGLAGSTPISISGVENVRLEIGNSAHGTRTVLGDDGANSLTAFAYFDTAYSVTFDGRGGDDSLSGDWGQDTLRGGSGNDTLWGGGNDDSLAGGIGDDSLNGGAGNDAIDGGEGADTAVFSGTRAGYTISTTSGTTTVTGPEGTDTLTGIEWLRFADGLFDLSGTQINPTINGASGPDTLTGDGNRDVINGLGGDDILGGAGGNDTLNGGDGDDVLDGGAGNDALNGGDGNDTVSYASAAAGATVQLAKTNDQNTIGAGRDTLSGIENLTGSAFRDYFTGDAGNNVLSDTLGGNDRFIGGAGNDTLSIERSGGGAATDVTLTGGIGDDTMTFDGHGRYTDTVVFEGQDGADVVTTAGAFRSNINTGAGNDTVTVDTMGGSFVVKLGSGSDTLILADTDGGFAGSTANIVRDFVAGAGGDIVDLSQYLAGGALTNYTPGDNPFLDGHMRLVQAGEDTLVQIDRDGGSNGFVTVLTLQKTFASNFTAYNFNGLAPLPAPVEGGSGADSLTGTSGIDVLNGNGGNDSLVGLAGADVLNGGAGNDVLDGGDGDDVLNGGSGGLGDTATYATASAGVNVNLGVLGLQNTVGSGFDSLTGIEHLIGSAFTDELRGDAAANQLTDTLGGNDFLRGEAGNDTLLITRSGGGAATTVRLNGGADNDALTFTGNGRFTDTVTLEGEAGNDVINVSGALTIGIDAGAGDDTVTYDTLGGEFRMTLGTGVDTVRLAGTGGLFQASSANLVRDFATGAGGDIVDLSAYLAGGALTNYTGGDNPFADGHMRLVQSGTRTLLQVDRDGGGNGYQTVLAFANTTVAAFTTANFNGFDPTGAVPAPLETSDKDAGPQVLPTAGDDFLVLPAAPEGDGPQVLPGVFDDGVPLKAGLFDFDRTAPFELVIGEDGLVTNGWDHRDHGQDGWLF
jgi:serralysin